MRVTMQFICVLRNLHVKEARRNNRYLRRAPVFFAVSTRGVPENIATLLLLLPAARPPTNGFPSVRFDLSMSFPQSRPSARIRP